MSRFKVRLVSWSTHGGCFFSSSLYTALFWPLLIKEAESFDFWILHPLTFAVDKWKCHSKAAWKCVAEEKVLLSGRHLDMSASDICLEIKVQQPIAAKPEAATIACYCFATNPPAAVSILLHSNISIFVNITGPPALLASFVALKGDPSWENGMFLAESRCVLLWEQTIEKSLIKTAVVNIWKLFTITENHFIQHLIWWLHNSSQDISLRWCYYLHFKKWEDTFRDITQLVKSELEFKSVLLHAVDHATPPHLEQGFITFFWGQQCL